MPDARRDKIGDTAFSLPIRFCPGFCPLRNKNSRQNRRIGFRFALGFAQRYTYSAPSELPFLSGQWAR